LRSPPAIKSLAELAKAETLCTRCPLYKNATQAVPGEGRRHAHLMLVGEEPGDKEDLAGKPFIGPAGQVLDRALAEADIPRTEVFVTNAVKHFKYELRGKRRLHKRPNTYEIERCKIWLELERALVKPSAIVRARGHGGSEACSAGRSPSPSCAAASCSFPTAPPPWSPFTRHSCCVSRTPPTRSGEYAHFVADLRLAAKILAKETARAAAKDVA
jgi:DNA polymerase